MRLLLIFISLLTIASGCNKWLDAKPKTLIESEQLFKSEKGFEDAMYGVYTTMSRSSLYGEQLTMSFLDVLAQQYNCQSKPSHIFYQVANYNYLDGGVKTRIDSIWSLMYFSITNLNNVLLNIEGKKSMFQPQNYDLIKGEAIGLRAFLHFDLLRLFGAPCLTGAAKPAIPYIKTVSGGVTPLSTVSAALDSVISELKTASALLSGYKTINYNYYEPENQLQNDWLNHRQSHFNYWAAEATLARAYLYKGDKQQALVHAQNVIDAGFFDFQTPKRISDLNDRTFIPEHVFALSKFDIRPLENKYFRVTGGVNVGTDIQLTNSYGNGGVVDQIYEINAGGVSDIRYGRLWELSGSVYFCSKWWQESSNPIFNNWVPLVRLPEMYYIAAECSDPATATTYLNTVREYRGVPDLPTGLDAAAVQQELLKEYQKEFYAEGQLFYYYKRLNSPVIRFSVIAPSERAYTLPLPDSELQYRN
ncbi:RagB/SusD family nutrient uptake outer membrane protein [Pseudobacter ginsenosidimutans]|uniref:SusD-like starch-binding protein associating with outer membrane n=1 Tax=Pseudobacter ginsenosidimutans TaxID=661488 RepID=A0A4Q7MRM2_9BACT|nr:RagB/SusD family nutrient uptake outer membrane protein [Pseudobacter ginsenosidimutans]QEC42082.1 RagB/SusD family nutrient uptake outer membrane protein [Pseudobacter ginsenosidimutans]RZS71078.1 SusD-like starch-binding protein associating with outer membrane [Pseudobacter ginsenosidimutans]